jgi:hypothetical protein
VGGGATPSGGAGGGCTSPPGSATGVTDKEIKIGVVLTNIGGAVANQAFGVASPEQQQATFEGVIDYVNANGGVACRKVVAKYMPVNPVDSSDVHAKCLEAVQAGVFAVLDSGSAAGAAGVGAACYGQNKLPLFVGPGTLTNKQVDAFFPYLFVPFVTVDNLAHNAVFALRDRGFFSKANGFSKLGFMYLNCSPEIVTKHREDLRAAGVADADIVSYDYGCPSAATISPSDYQQAILKFRQSGVTHVTFVNLGGGFHNFTKIAQQQGFKPKYGFPDETITSTSYGTNSIDYNNIDGAIAISASRFAEERTPGMTPSPATAKCNEILKSRGLPTAYQQRFGGTACNDVWMFEAAVERASTLTREAMAQGLKTAKSVDFAYPQGPNDFTGRRPTVGGQFWRPVQFTVACNCWRVADATFRPSFP